MADGKKAQGPTSDRKAFYFSHEILLSLNYCPPCAAVDLSNLFVEPEHGAHHSDVSKANPLSHKEGTGVQMLVQHSKDPLDILLRLLCGLDRSRKMTMQDFTSFVVCYISKYRECCSLANWLPPSTTATI